MPLRYYRAKVINALVSAVTEWVRDFEKKNSGQVMEDESNDFVSEIIRVVVDTKDGTCNKAPEYLAEQFLLLVSPSNPSTSRFSDYTLTVICRTFLHRRRRNPPLA